MSNIITDMGIGILRNISPKQRKELIQSLNNKLHMGMSTTTKFKNILSLINSLSLGNASQFNVLSGYTFTNNSNRLLSGTMPNNGSVGGTITSQGGSIYIPAGYTSGGVVTATYPEDTGVIVATGNAQPGDVRQGKTFSNANANNLVGTLEVDNGNYEEGTVLKEDITTADMTFLSEYDDSDGDTWQTWTRQIPFSPKYVAVTLMYNDGYTSSWKTKWLIFGEYSGLSVGRIDDPEMGDNKSETNGFSISISGSTLQFRGSDTVFENRSSGYNSRFSCVYIS